jgi:hypothetical protein
MSSSDLLGVARDERDGTDLVAGGLHPDVAAWNYHVFETNGS